MYSKYPIKPKVSVIMPVYNGEAYLEKALNSVLSQTYKNFEFLIIDDFSEDNTVEIISSYNDERIKLYKNKSNLGSLLSRNILMEKAKGKYIIFQDSDDFSNHNRFEILVDIMESDEKIGLCGSNYDLYDKRLNWKFSSNKPTDNEQIRNDFYQAIPITFATTIVRFEVIQRIGLFKTFFKDLGNYDYDWMFRISEKYKCMNTEKKLYNVVRFDTSNSLNIVNPQKKIGDRIVLFLANQRKISGTDFIEENKIEELQLHVDSILSVYEQDPTKYLYELLHGTLSENRYRKSLIICIKIITKRPLRLYNYKTFLYVLKKYFYELFRFKR